MEDVLVITSNKELETYMKKYACETKEQLEDVLWYNYGITLEVKIQNHKL